MARSLLSYCNMESPFLWRGTDLSSGKSDMGRSKLPIGVKFLFLLAAVGEAWCKKKDLIMSIYRVSVLLSGEQTQGIFKLDPQVTL